MHQHCTWWIESTIAGTRKRPDGFQECKWTKVKSVAFVPATKETAPEVAEEIRVE
jgi:hypothetical protein